MRRLPIFYLSLVVLTLILGLAGCSKQEKANPTQGSAKTGQNAKADPATTPPKPVTEPDRSTWPVIVAFGDSLTEGLGVPAAQNYPAQLQAELDKAGYKYRVVNAGISGDTTAGGLNRIDGVLRQKPAIVIVELGANDGLQGKSVPQMERNLTTMIQRFKGAGIQVVLAGMQVPPNLGPDYVEAYQNAFPKVAAAQKIPMIPFFLDQVAGIPELNQMDGIHPTPEGYTKVVQNVLTTLQPLLEK